VRDIIGNNLHGGYMSRTGSILVLACITAIAGCRDSSVPTSPDLSVATARGEVGAPATVRMMDACDPATFAEIGCERNGGVTLDQFISQLGRLGRAPAWQFAPGDLFLTEGAEYVATNFGGEVHTFTEVDEFGGGIVAALNNLIGETEVAPECTALTSGDFIPPGGSVSDEAEEVGDEHYQCCIHPWMRMTVHVREH
jgi:hypothetical protein